MDIHCKIAAGLSIAVASLELLVLAIMAAFLGGVASFSGLEMPFLGWFAAFGSVFIGLFALLALVELVAAICYLRGSKGARIWLIVFNVLFLFNFPVGTLLGGYCLWALLRQPKTGSVIIIDNRAE